MTGNNMIKHEIWIKEFYCKAGFFNMRKLVYIELPFRLHRGDIFFIDDLMTLEEALINGIDESIYKSIETDSLEVITTHIQLAEDGDYLISATLHCCQP